MELPFDLGDIAKSVGGFLDEYGVPLGMGLQAGGTLARRAALNRVREEQARIMAENAARQRRIQAQQDAAVAAAIPQFTPGASEAARLKIAQDYESYMRPTVQADLGEYGAGNVTGPDEVRERGEAELSKARTKGADYAKNLANLSSYSGLDLQQGIALNRTGQEVSRLGDASRGYSAVLPYQLDGASKKGDTLNLVADVMNAGGNLAFLYGATAPKKPAPAPTYSGTGITLPQQGGLSIYGSRTGLNPSRSNVGLRVPRG